MMHMMRVRSNRKGRRSLRLAAYDYSQIGAYFITIVTSRRACLFGAIVDGAMHLNPSGLIVQSIWCTLPEHFKGIATDAFTVMPNHVHGIIHIVDPGGAQHAAPAKRHIQPGSLGTIVRSFKSAVTKRYNELHGLSAATTWQRNYYEHIIRNENALIRIREYIETNPLRWPVDPENPLAVTPESNDLRQWINSDRSNVGAQRAAPLPRLRKI